MKKIYIGRLYRFGYELTVADTTEKKVVDALMEEYAKAFMDLNNGEDPREEISDSPYADGETFYENAKECIEIEPLEIGKVEWR